MSFDEVFLETLREAVPLADVIGRRVRLRRQGRELSGLCPFHQEKTPSFTVSESKGFYHCFGCGAHGDVISFVMHTEGLTFPEAVERLAASANLPMPVRDPKARQAEARRAGLHDALEKACQWFEMQLAGPHGGPARDYLSARGLEPATITQFRIGFAPAHRGLLRQALNAQGFGDQLLVEAGLIKPAEGGETQPRDYFFGRIVFPITDRRGRVIAFGGRALSPEAKAKYLNSPDTALFHKGKVLYNLPRARQAARDSGELIVCEGYMDVIAMAQAGFPAAVAPLGTAVTEEQIAELWRMVPEPIVCLDGDDAGRRAGFRMMERALAQLRPGCTLRFAALPAGDDPDSLLRSQGPQALRRVLDGAQPLADLLWSMITQHRNFDTPERRAGLRRDLLAMVACIRDRDVQTAYRRDMLGRYDQAFGWKPRSAVNPGSSVPGGGALRPPPQALRRRPVQVLLALAVTHPDVALDWIEELAVLDLADEELSGLRGRLVDLLAERPDLDFTGLKCHLCAEGYAGLLDFILSRAVQQHEPLATPQALPGEVRRRFGYWIRRVRESAGGRPAGTPVHREIEDIRDVQFDRMQAERALAEDTTAQQRVIERYEAKDQSD